MAKDILDVLPAGLRTGIGYAGDDAAALFDVAGERGLLRALVDALPWDQILTHRGLVVNSLGHDLEAGHDLVGRPECGILFAAEILTGIGAGKIAQMEEEAMIPFHRARRNLGLHIVEMIRSGTLVRADSDPVAAHWLLARLVDDFEAAGGAWVLDRTYISEVVAQAEADFTQGECGVAFEGETVKTGEMLDRASLDGKIHLHPAHRLARAERLVRRVLRMID